MRLRDLKEGQLVVYTPKDELGFVTSWNNTAVFVRYYNPTDGRFQETAAATVLADLVPFRGPILTRKE